MKKSLKQVSKKHGILEIIADDPKERASSSELNINQDVYLFLRRIDLEFLSECFSGDNSYVTLPILRSFTIEQLEEILEGSMYVPRIRKELERVFSSTT